MSKGKELLAASRQTWESQFASAFKKGSTARSEKRRAGNHGQGAAFFFFGVIGSTK